jgi:hypothetical protein
MSPKIWNDYAILKGDPKWNMFELTYNNIELSLYYSIRNFSARLRYFLYGGKNYKYRYQEPSLSALLFLNNIGDLRPTLFEDRFKYIKRNKLKYLYLFILFIIVVEYYIPTSIIESNLKDELVLEAKLQTGIKITDELLASIFQTEILWNAADSLNLKNHPELLPYTTAPRMPGRV